jgi:hypothetical protein
MALEIISASAARTSPTTTSTAAAFLATGISSAMGTVLTAAPTCRTGHLGTNPVARCQLHLQLDNFIPLRISALTFWNGKQLT